MKRGTDAGNAFRKHRRPSCRARMLNPVRASPRGRSRLTAASGCHSANVVHLSHNIIRRACTARFWQNLFFEDAGPGLSRTLIRPG